MSFRWKEIFSLRWDPNFLYHLHNGPQYFYNKHFLSGFFPSASLTSVIRWPIKRQVSTFHNFVCNVPTVLGKWDENLDGMSQKRMSLLGFHICHSTFKCMFLVNLLCFLKSFFQFSLAEKGENLTKGGMFTLHMYSFVKGKRRNNYCVVKRPSDYTYWNIGKSIPASWKRLVLINDFGRHSKYCSVTNRG